MTQQSTPAAQPPPRLLFVHAHPDDESLWTGGLIARHAAAGGEVEVVICTWVDGTARHGEAVNALAELGAPRPPIMLGYADDRVPESAPGGQRFCVATFNDEVRELVGIIRDFRPDAIVTYDPIGIYGHPDHMHAHRLTCVAADAAAVPGMYRRIGQAWQTRSLYFVTVADWMVDDVAPDVFPTIARENLPGTAPELISLNLDVSPWVDTKRAAINAHKTEVDRSRTISMLMGLPPERRGRLLGTECYIRRDLTADGCDL